MSDRRFVVQEIVECPQCGGKGTVPESFYKTTGRYVKVDINCKNCLGNGYVYKVVKLSEALEDLGIITRRS